METHELLRAYAQEHSESAFQELVHRYVDLVYSAAIRCVDGDTQLAEDVTQEVFTNLAGKARSLPPNVSLGGWLHRHTGFAASTAMRSEQRRRNRERQVAEMNALIEPSEADWKRLASVLDEALDELDPADRDALVLRYFERRELRAVGAALGVSDDTAQKRVSRALDKCREHLSRRGIRSTATALSAVLSANAVQAAPTGLASALSAVALAGAPVAATASAAAGKVIAMTTLQKTLITATIAVLAGAAIYEAHHAGNARAEVQTLQQQQTPLTEQIRQLQQERNETANQLAALRDKSERLSRDAAEVLRLRGEVGVLRRQVAESRFRKPASTVTNAVQNFEDKPGEYLTKDGKRVIMSVHVGWRISDAAAFSLKFPGDSALTTQHQLEDIAGSTKAAVIGTYNLSDCVNSDPSELKLDKIEKEIQTVFETELTKNNYGVSIEFLSIGTLD